MKKKLLLVAAVFAAFAFLFAACDNGTTTNSPVPDLNAQQLGKLQGSGIDNDNYRWVFSASGTAPDNSATFMGAKYLVIATAGGGKIDTVNNVLQFTGDGFEPIEMEIAGQGTTWDSWATTRVKPQATNWIVPFTHTATDIVYFVYDLSAFNGLIFSQFTDPSATNIEIRFTWGVAVLALGDYKAYLTSEDLSSGASAAGNTLLKMDMSNYASSGQALDDPSLLSWLLPDGTVYGWITKTIPAGLLPD